MEKETFKDTLKKGDVIEFRLSDGESIKAVVLKACCTYFDYFENGVAELGSYKASYEYLLYVQNKLFVATNEEVHRVWTDYDYDLDKDIEQEESTFTSLKYRETVVEYCVIPSADEKLNHC